MSLANLAQFATKPVQAGKTPFYALPLEEARGKVAIKDSRKPQNVTEDGDVPLALYAGKIRVSLDIISKGATAITVPVGDVESVTEQLQEALNSGEFDEAIAEAQAKGKEAAEKAQASKAANAEASDSEEEETTEAPADVDLDELG